MAVTSGPWIQYRSALVEYIIKQANWSGGGERGFSLSLSLWKPLEHARRAPD